MDRANKKSRKEKKRPRVPIKTYRWEDIHRARLKGGYPWTHLYKQPFNETLDVEPYTMEGLRKTKSSSTVGKSDTELVSEFSDVESSMKSGEIPEKMDTLQIVTEHDNHSSKNSASSLIIEELNVGDKDDQYKEILESAESWDNISQYLDNEDTGPVNHKPHEEVEDVQAPEASSETAPTNLKLDEEPQDASKRKRKLSAESSYSKISQTKSAIIQKFVETKKKIKVPKLSFSTNKLKKPKTTSKKKNSPPEIKKEIKKSAVQSAKDVNPVYIHIPLRPPPGQTDEFSNLEFGEKNKEPARKPGSFRDLIKNIKQLQEQSRPDEKQQNELNNKQTEEKTLEHEEDKENLNTEKSQEENKQKTKSESKLNDGFKENIVKETLEEKTLDNADVFKKCDKYLHMPVEDVSVKKTDNQLKEQKNLEQDILEETPVESKSTESKEEDIFDHLFKASASKKGQEPTKTQTRKNVRSKSAEPEGRRRKLSLESSYSRKSLSKLSIMKKLKDASDYLKNTLTRSDSKKKPKIQKEEAGGEAAKKSKEELPTKEENKTKPLKSDKPVKPVYIHIPLKPPEGESDEFSYLKNAENPAESKETKSAQPIKQESTSTSTPPESPVQTGKNDVQFIILTAPSDDETLDYNSSDVCETPSSEHKLFFGNKITELKNLAKDAVDGVTNLKTKLESVDEDTNGEKEADKKADNLEPAKAESKVENIKDISNESDAKVEEIQKGKELKSEEPKKPADAVIEKNATKKETKKVMVDEEDGLEQEAPEEKLETKQLPETKEEPQTIAEPIDEQPETPQSPEFKSSLKQGSPPVIKKKVSFKRRSKTSKDGSYEDIQAPELHLDINKAEEDSKRQTEPPISLVDKIIASTSKDEDKWSKVSDHEYEPVNPPPVNIDLPPQVYIIDTDYDTSILPLGTISFAQTTVPSPEKKIKEETEIKNEVKPETIAQVAPVMKPPENASKTSTSTLTPQASEKGKGGPSKFQLAFKQKTDNIKNKFQNMKRPSMPERSKFNKPDFKKFKIEKPKFNTEKLKFHIEKPKFNLPKIPDTAKINLPNISLKRKHSGKRTQKERQFSTESNAGDSKKPFFDFSTYPRIFKKKSNVKQDEKASDFATIPRSKKSETSTPSTQTGSGKWSGSDSIRIPLHSEDSMGNSGLPKNMYFEPEHNDHNGHNEETFDDDRDVAITNQDSSRIRYDADIDIDDEYEGENNELIGERDFLNRWEHGRFNEEYNDEYLENLKNSNYKVTDLDSPEENPDMGYDYNSNGNKDRDRYSSTSSFGHRRGVMEEINSDEFFWRPKGISQDDIHISMNISSEIRQAFQTPQNALRQIENLTYYNYDDQDGSRHSLQEITPKRKPVKKPKRKKTPHTSQERIPKAEESAEDDGELIPPSRPKRRSKRKKKEKNIDDFVPYRETISLDRIPSEERLIEHRESLGGILGDDERDDEIIAMYENEKMEGKEQPEIQITNSYSNFQYADEDNENSIQQPAAPPRKQKSLKSLNLSEHDSILGDFSSTRAILGESKSEKDLREPKIEAIRTESKVIIPIVDSEVPPKRPSRMRSQIGSRSRGTSIGDEESLSRATSQVDEENCSRTDFDLAESPIPCVEEPCFQDIRDPMGYAIVDKSKVKDPPLPPPRISSRQKRSSLQPKDAKFNTVPARKTNNGEMPMRPLRNYSTLVQAKTVLDRGDNKENIDLTPYIEIDDEPSRKLQSGEVIQKMKDRPLPAPPRPPRKGRVLKDITSEENIISKLTDNLELDKEKLEETEVSTQTEPLPDDFVCEELVQEPSDRILMPSSSIPAETIDENSTDTLPKKDEEPVDRIEKRLITPTQFSYEETVTHGSLLVEPLNGVKILQDSELTRVSKERIVPINRESEDETSSVPDEFHKLSYPPDTKKIESSAPRPLTAQGEMEVLKAQKLQVADLDVDRLTVNQLLANKIIVSDIESRNIQTNEISSKSGTLTVGEINLPPSVIEQIVQSIRTNESPEASSEAQKKTSTNKKSQEEEILVDTLIEEIIEVTEKPYIIKEPVQFSQKSSDMECSDIYSSQKVSSAEGLENQAPQKSSSLESLEHQIISESIEDISPETNILEHEIHLEQDELNSPPIPPPRSAASEQVQKIQESTDDIENSSHINVEERENILEIFGNQEVPPRSLPRSVDTENLEKPPSRPPRDKSRKGSISTLGESVQEPDVDDEPPPRPPDPQLAYIPSQPPASFYALRAQKYVDENIPMVPRRRRRTRSRPRSRSRSTSEDSSPVRRHRSRSSEPSITQLSCQLVQAARDEIHDSLKRLINYFMNNVLGNADGKQDLNVIILIVLVVIAGLILLGGEDERTVIHMHHWEYFNPPRDL